MESCSVFFAELYKKRLVVLVCVDDGIFLCITSYVFLWVSLLLLSCLSCQLVNELLCPSCCFLCVLLSGFFLMDCSIRKFCNLDSWIYFPCASQCGQSKWKFCIVMKHSQFWIFQWYAVIIVSSLSLIFTTIVTWRQ
mgnify:CR=1 FL=1